MVLKSVSRSYLSRHTSQLNSRLTISWLRWLNEHLRQAQGKPSAEAGFTLIEALVAIVVVAIIMVAITPPVFMATATRVQQRRAQQALQLAQGEIDRVRTLVERGTYSLTDLPVKVASLDPVAASSASTQKLKSVRASCNSYDGKQLGATEFLPVDVTGDCQSDFLLQAFRTEGAGETTTTEAGDTLTATPKGFKMGVRVYVDTPTLRSNFGSLETDRASLTFTTGLKQQTMKPIAVLRSTVVRNDTSDALQNYRSLCDSAGGC